ncbi:MULTISPECIES: polysaccharide deacetylase family protein [Brucella]|uniref:polysaccharide deacetylase family protein n=1 Tax=Brucella TaxID=234 RepID=UPI00158866FF|nr:MULTISPECIES: polysaccharide deacetylase family protein [Brucella]WLF97131.1 polysaccharide deacetylase family protein [Brucella intermedia]
MAKTVLMYHQIASVPEIGAPFRGLNVAPENFKSQMQWLARLGYQGLSLRELAPYINGEKQGRVVGITFDDGFENVHKHALPILSELGFTATCFFVSGEIGGYNRWDEAIGIPHTPCMSTTQVLDWARAGNEVGAHTVNHVSLTDVDPAESFRQIKRSKLQLEDLTGQQVRSFCYPYGNVSRNIRDMVAKAGFRLATTTRKARASASDDPLLLPRRNIRHCNGWIATLRKAAFG